MSYNVHRQEATARTRASTAKFATSCTECRRRKQKCNRGQPCSNCVRRFPQPSCEYSTRVIRRAGLGLFLSSQAKIALQGYAHLDLTEVQDVIFQVEGLIMAGMGDDVVGGDRVTADTSNCAPWSMTSAPDSRPTGRSIVGDRPGTLGQMAANAMIQFILQARLNVTKRILNDEWHIDGSQLLQAVLRATRPPPMIGSLDDQLRNLPMEPTRLNMELVRIHLQLFSRFKASIDGNPDPESRFMKHWLPLSIRDPLLLHIVLYTAASFLHETGRAPKALAWAYKGMVHKMLNEHLRCKGTQISDVSIQGATQMVINSWYWGTTEELRAHMAGLKTMVRLRGGPQSLGMQGFLAKTVLMHDIVIALAHEVEPTMFGVPGFDFHDGFMVPYQVSLNSPLLSNWPPFRSPASTLRIHPLSAALLDDMRSVLTFALSLPPRATTEELQRVEETARSSFEKLKRMPAEVAVHDPREDSGLSGAFVHDDAIYGNGHGNDNEVDHPPPSRTSSDSGSSPRCVGPPRDLMYLCIRQTASIYYRAMISRVPTAQVVSTAEVVSLWGLVWGVTVSVWKKAVGIFLWILTAIVPGCHQTPVARFFKTFIMSGFMMMGMENWHVGVDMAFAALQLQKWLREGGRADAIGRGAAAAAVMREENDDGKNVFGRRNVANGVIGGEKMIEEHGYLFRKQLAELGPIRLVDDEEGLIE